MTISQRKQCTRCRVVKDLGQFKKNAPRGPDKPVTLNSRCNECRTTATLEAMWRREERIEENRRRANGQKV